MLNSNAGQPGDVVDIELRHQICTMPLNRAGRYVQHLGDSLVGIAFGDQLQDFIFSRRELFDHVGVLDVFPAGQEPVHDDGRYWWAEIRFSPGDCLDRQKQLLSHRTLEQVTPGASL